MTNKIMNKSLYVFVTSERPDSYLNPILHCIDKENINRVVLVDVVGLGSNGQKNIGISDKVMRNTQTLLYSLAKLGEYQYFVGKLSQTKVDLKEKLEEEEVLKIERFYSDLLEKKITWEHIDIDYLKLKETMDKIIKQNPNSLFDVTSFDKSLIGDIVSISIIGKIKNINTFDLNIRPDFDEPWNMLYHNLKSEYNPNSELNKAKYNYVNIIQTPIFNECEKSILLFSLPFKLSIIITLLVFAVYIAVFWIKGSQNILILSFGIVSSFVSFWSAFFPFFTRKK